MTDPYEDHERVTRALLLLADQATGTAPPKANRIIGEGRLKRRRHRRFAAAAGLAAVVGAAAVVVPRLGSSSQALRPAGPVEPAACPEPWSGPTLEAPAATVGGSGGILVPSTPEVATVCWYLRPVAGANLLLDRRAIVRGDQLRALTARLNATPPGNLGGGDRSCPPEDVSGVWWVGAYFRYSSDRSVTVYAELTGCRFASNGAFVTIPDQDVFDGLSDTP